MENNNKAKSWHENQIRSLWEETEKSNFDFETLLKLTKSLNDYKKFIKAEELLKETERKIKE